MGAAYLAAAGRRLGELSQPTPLQASRASTTSVHNSALTRFKLKLTTAKSLLDSDVVPYADFATTGCSLSSSCALTCGFTIMNMLVGILADRAQKTAEECVDKLLADALCNAMQGNFTRMDKDMDGVITDGDFKFMRSGN